MSTIGRKPLKYILLDLPSDHEIEGDLATECDVLYAMLANHELAAVTKRVRIGRPETLTHMRLSTRRPEVVHIAGHATVDGLWMLGEVLPWVGVAKSLAACVTTLKSGQERIVNFSCCYSEKAARTCRRRLAPFFSGAYHFLEPNIAYAKAIVTWTMFFHQRPTTANHREIVERITTFLGGEVLRYMPYRREVLPVDESVAELNRLARRT